MDESLFEILDNIYKDIEDNNSSISLMAGGPGVVLFKLYYLKYIKNNELDENIIDSIRELSEASINYNNLTSLCDGQAGINWFFSILYNQEYIDKRDYKVITSSDFSLAKAGLDYMSAKFYDFLHGGVGIAHYLLYSKRRGLLPFFNEFLDRLNILMDQGNPVLGNFNFDLKELDSNEINPGLAHGLASVLKLCIECYGNRVYKNKSKNLAKRIVDFLLDNINIDRSHSYFPVIYDLIHNDRNKSRLAWCYGDLGIAYILYQYSLMFNDNYVKTISIEILHHSSDRRTELESGVKDASFCHGSSGAAHIFSKLWCNTGDAKFGDAANYWFQKTIDYSIYQDGPAGYKTYKKGSLSSLKDHSLLSGVAGIGLAIISHLFQDYSWDYCLMLND